MEAAIEREPPAGLGGRIRRVEWRSGRGNGEAGISGGDVELPNWLARALGVGDRIVLEIPAGADRSTSFAIRPDASGRVFVPLVAVGYGGAGRSPVFLRVLPFDGRSASASSGAPGRWVQEWHDLSAPGGATAGLLRPLSPGGPGGAPHPVFPPLFFCTEKRVLVPAVCPGCSGRASGADSACAVCGSEGGGGDRPEGVRSPLDALWHRARQDAAGAGGEGGPADPPCVRCDRRETCYPPSGPSSDAGTAGSVLVAWSDRPWGGMLVEPFHLPFGAWCRLVAGTPWEDVRADLRALPEAVLAEADARMAGDRATLFPPAAGEPFVLESALLRLEMLRQLLTVLAFLAAERGHPHLGLAESALWIRLEASDSLRTALWSASVRLLDPAPGWAGAGGEGGAGIHRSVAGRPPEMTPQGCDRVEAWAEGLCIPRAGASAGEGERIAVDFLPHVHFDRPPGKGDAVVLSLSGGRAGGGDRLVHATVEVAFPEVCSVVVDDPSLPAGEARALFGGGAPLARLRTVRDHSLVDDLYGAGTLFLASLAAQPADLAAVAVFRNGVAPQLRAVRASSSIETEIHRAIGTSGLFAGLRAGIPVESGQAGGKGRTVENPALVGRMVSLGLRLCGAVPNGYPFQDHEPVGRVEREQAYGLLLGAVTALSREVRERLLGARPPESDVPMVLVDYLRERLGDAGDRTGRVAGRGGRR